MSINTDQYIGKQLKSAVDKADLATVKDICESEGFDINATLIEYYGRCTVLYYAVHYNKVPIARYLLTLQQVDVTVLHTYYRISPLHRAVLRNNSELVALLLQRGAELNLQDRWGDSPLACAARYEHQEVGELLVSGPVKALLVATEEQATLAATKELLKMYVTTSAVYRAAVTTFIVETEMEGMRQILSKNSQPETSNRKLREASSRLLNIISGDDQESDDFTGSSDDQSSSDQETGTSSSTARQEQEQEQEQELTATQLQLLQVYEAIKAEYTATISNLTDDVSSYIAEIVQQGQSM